ncbi:MAG TPA: YebC/PmpR family DNA-binding transcriptional regulator [Patescibacteria group bacterium]|nr:YebC/PmpR family DNA-binding transcriptional regulator [Patescibacteria group bacterium]
MSGHSKWAQIKRTKGVLDQKRGLLFSKLSKKISIAVKEGGGSTDPGANYKLKAAIDYAKDQGMPNDNIERAVKNTSNAGEIKEVVYEGYGPYGTAFLVEAATDNPNRSTNNIKHIFSKHGGNLGSQGSVAWQFQSKGQILVERDRDDLAELQLAAIDAGAQDVRESAEGLEVYTLPNDLDKIKQALAAAGARIARADIIQESSQGTDLTEEQKPKVDALFAELENDEDVIAVHTSANL